MNKIIFAILLCVILTSEINIWAQEADMAINADYTTVLTQHNALLLSDNPSAIYWNVLDSIGQLSLGYRQDNGNYKPSMMGASITAFHLDTDCYRRINKTMLWGAFEYKKSIEEGMSFTNLYAPYRDTPYLYADTIGGDAYDREEFSFKTQLSTPLTERLILGMQCDYKVGLGAQNRDPRAESKIMCFNSKTGLFYIINNHAKIGASATYTYLNEDIDISIIENNTMHTIFNLTGLGTYSKHESSSFYRLYKRHTLGGQLQLATGNNLLEFGYRHLGEIIMDGRKEGNASWAAIKSDAHLRGRIFSLSDTYTIMHRNNCHQIRLNADKYEIVGSEILQKLHQVIEGFDMEQWLTISEEDKYTNTIQTASISYVFSQYKKVFLRNHSIGFNLKMTDKQEVYYLPNQGADYSCLNYSLSFTKLFSWKRHSLDSKVSVGAQKNLSQHLSFAQETIITDLIIVPDHDYFSSDNINGSVNLSYNYSLSNKKRIIISAKYQLAHSDHYGYNEKYTSLKLSTGYLF